jgi:leucyl/phenylalanyl-tRNA--protein transferase
VRRARDGFQPLFLEKDGPLVFPDPRLADGDGLLAVGGDLSEDRLLLAYRHGIFPWYDERTPPFWWSPDPRAVLPLDDLHVSRRLLQTIRRGGYELSWNREFRRVMTECQLGREGGSWIFVDMLDAYTRLHEHGHAHSIEAWRDGELVGGVYGVQIGALFAAESMFHRARDMSKIALVALARSLHAAGIEVFDVQYRTGHLAGFGAIEWPRDTYLERVASAVERDVDLSALELRV